jgi:hypothetical protein
LGATSSSSSDESSVSDARDNRGRVERAAGFEVGAKSEVSKESSVLSVAEKPREVFAISLIDARARARAVIQHERVASGRVQASDEAPGTGGILEREPTLAAGTDDGNGRAGTELELQRRHDHRTVDV